MKRWKCAAAGLLCAGLCACSMLPKLETASSPIDAALKTVAAVKEGEDPVRLRAEDLDEEELFRAVEAIWPFACTMQLTVYAGGMLEIELNEFTEAQQAQAETLAQGMAKEAVAGLTQDAEKLRALHDLLVRSCVYDLETAEKEGATDGAAAPFTAYGALVDGKAVCAGYARAFVLLCQAAGMDAIYIADERMNHGWNAVRLDGKTYFIDCTFDDPVPDRGEYVSHEYFLRSAEELAETHTWDREFYERVMDAKWGVSTANDTNS
ncbi:MAG: hypothetical protein KHW93_07410 [Butyricicoccus pullicaecorum]|nr:hypothetical protein [Butyricicoccus pullicaecorum]